MLSDNRKQISTLDETPMSKLTPQEMKFVETWIETMDVVEAVRVAGYKADATKQTSTMTPRALGRRLLNKKRIQESIQWYQSKRKVMVPINGLDIIRILWQEAQNEETGTAQTRIAAARELAAIMNIKNDHELLGTTPTTSKNSNNTANQGQVIVVKYKDEEPEIKAVEGERVK